MGKSFTFIFFLLGHTFIRGIPLSQVEKNASFGARILRVNREVELVYFKFDFENGKYLNKDDRVKFWNERNHLVSCEGDILGRTSDTFLLKVPNINFCERRIPLSVGAYMMFHSEDMKNNMIMGTHLVKILLKKRSVVSAMAERWKRELNSHMEKVNAVNVKYDVLRKKLEAEWQEQLQTLEEDRVAVVREHKSVQRQLDEIDSKLEQYKIEEDNFSLDRWSLDSRLYYER